MVTYFRKGKAVVNTELKNYVDGDTDFKLHNMVNICVKLMTNQPCYEEEVCFSWWKVWELRLVAWNLNMNV